MAASCAERQSASRLGRSGGFVGVRVRSEFESWPKDLPRTRITFYWSNSNVWHPTGNVAIGRIPDLPCGGPEGHDRATSGHTEIDPKPTRTAPFGRHLRDRDIVPRGPPSPSGTALRWHRGRRVSRRAITDHSDAQCREAPHAAPKWGSRRGRSRTGRPTIPSESRCAVRPALSRR